MHMAGDARLTLHEFLRLFTRGPKPESCMKRLSSIGKMVLAVEREQVEQHAGGSAHGRARGYATAEDERRLEHLDEISTEAVVHMHMHHASCTCTCAMHMHMRHAPCTCTCAMRHAHAHAPWDRP